MRWLRTIAVISLLAVLAVGCGRSHLKTKGRVVKNGAPYLPTQGEVLRLTMVPILKEGNPTDLYAAEFNEKNGTFQVAGKDLRGMPPGKYRVAIEYKGRNRPFSGNLDEENSPYVFDVDASTKEIVIDLDQPPAIK